MVQIIGSGYAGTEDITTSTANQELVVKPEGFTIYQYYKFEFKNYEACHVLINGKTRLYLDAFDGFEMNMHDQPLYSFIIEEANIKYIFAAGVK